MKKISNNPKESGNGETKERKEERKNRKYIKHGKHKSKYINDNIKYKFLSMPVKRLSKQIF